ncbi:1611_t:CDS:2 [Cetraspora pellucida]|uniref:1611_t:CDS:1 n=1 Tax=Cetraspora pellucida TaxID=1433469 RepID=A0ACA9L4U2_9GLOM|nr:1611_t:CDS:2 [Cetraspora pellucida]
MSLKSQLRVGQTINLLNGIYPSFNDPFKLPSGSDKETSQLPQEVLKPKNYLFDFTICLTDNWNILYSHIVDIYFSERIDVSPVTDGNARYFIYIDEEETIDSITPFTFYRQDKLDAIKLNLANLAGINNEDASLNSNAGYLLVKMSRINHVWTQNNLDDFLRKSTSDIISPTTKELIDFFSKSGTHCISEITFGNCVYQVFVYENDKYNYVKSMIQKHKFEDILSFFDIHGYVRIYNNNVGYIKYAGELKLASQDPLPDNVKENIKDKLINDQGQPSIFKIAQLERLESIFINTTAIGLKLTSLIEYPDPNPLRSEWSNTLGSALLQKFDLPNKFLKFSDNQWSNIYKDFISPFTSIIITPTLTISQVYIDLDTFHRDHDLIYMKPTRLILLADIIHISTEVELPGDEIVIAARMISVTSPKSKIIISSNIYENCKFFFDQVSPAIVIQQKNSIERMTISEKAIALIVKQPDLYNNNEIPSLIDIKYVFNDEYLKNTFFSQINSRIINGIEFLLMSIESISHARLNDDSELKIAAKEFIIWIFKITSTLQSKWDEDSIKNLNQKASILYYDRFPSPNTPLLVPFLRYHKYNDTINSYLDSIKLYQTEAEKTINKYNEKIQKIHEAETQTINLNYIKEICMFLKNQAIIESEKEESASIIYSKNYLKIDQDLTEIKNQIHKLQNKLVDGKKDMKFLFDKLKDGLDEWNEEKEQEKISNIIAYIKGIGKVIGAMFTSNTEGVVSGITDIKEISDKVDKIVKVIQEVNKLLKFLDETQANPTLPTLDNIPTPIMALDWEEWTIHVKSVLNLIPENEKMLTKLKDDYYSSVKIMKNRGIAFVNMLYKKYELENNKKLIDLRKENAKKQSVEWKNIGEIFTRNDKKEIEKFVKSSLDFGNLIETFKARVNLLTGQLVKILMDQDKAAQYEYFTNPILLESYQIDRILDFVRRQHTSMTEELINFPTSPVDLKQPYIYSIVIPSEVLSDKSSSGFYFDISTNDPFFKGYYRIRINEIQIILTDDSITTRDKKIYFEIYTNASPFYDIRFNPNSGEYTKISYFLDHQGLLFSGFYDIEKKKYDADVITRNFRNTFIQITPFTGWQIRIPRDRSTYNQNLNFLSTTIGINVIFKLNAIITI